MALEIQSIFKADWLMIDSPELSEAEPNWVRLEAVYTLLKNQGFNPTA
jgi:hypothetical protein